MRRGVAIAVVLFMLTLVSALVVSGVYATRRLAGTQRDDDDRERLEFAAESALVNAVVAWDSGARTLQAIGSVSASAAIDSSGANVDLWITRLSPSVYWLVAESSQGARTPLRRRIGLLSHVVAGVAEAVPDHAWTELP